MINISALRQVGLAIIGGFFGLLILAMAPTLLREATSSMQRIDNTKVRLVAMEEEFQETEKLEPEPEPPEPEIMPGPLEMAPPEIEIEEMPPSEPDYELPTNDYTSNAISLPSVTGLGMKVSTKRFSRSSRSRALPSLPKHGPPRTRFNSDEVDKQPEGVITSQPMYPYRAKRLNIEGAVHIRFLVNRAGATDLFKVIKSAPPGEFDKAVEKTVKHWKFKPALKDGCAVETWVETTIQFNLQ